MEHWKELEIQAERNPVDTIKLISGAHRRTAETSMVIGNHVHKAVENVISSGLHPNGDDELPHMRHFHTWCVKYKPDFLLSEATVYNRTEGYAGTLDIVANIMGENTLIDIKTGNAVYPEVALQLTAYAHGEFIGKNNMEIAMPTIDKTAVLHLRPNKWTYVPVRMDDEVWQAFRYIKEAFRWQENVSKSVLGMPSMEEEKR